MVIMIPRDIFYYGTNIDKLKLNLLKAIRSLFIDLLDKIIIPLWC